MTSEVLAALIRANLVAGLAILAVLALRLPMRRLFGPELAYGLWAVPPIAFVATLMPPPVVMDDPAANPFALAHDHSTLVLAVWMFGLAAAVTLFARAQLTFLADARAGRAGPSVVGVINPRIVMASIKGFGSTGPPTRAPARWPPPSRRCAGSTRWSIWPPTRCGWTRSWPATRAC